MQPNELRARGGGGPLRAAEAVAVPGKNNVEQAPFAGSLFKEEKHYSHITILGSFPEIQIYYRFRNLQNINIVFQWLAVCLDMLINGEVVQIESIVNWNQI